ncbi:hypothetical protein RCL1_001508 [Eukaryota sp. TZLM3-RCL]
MIKRSNITSLWQKRCISNFDYLMFLNTIAGRTYNDLSQYPIMPWVLKDYTSSSLELTNPSVYRDFTRPIGAQLDKQLPKLQRKFEESRIGGDPVTDQYKSNTTDRSQYHHGFHYMTPATVIYFLVRLEPFASLCIDYHGRNSFDDPDRMFFSIGKTWENLLVSPADIRELTPEFYCSDLFLRNVNRIDFGETSVGRDIHSVELPPWAKNDPDLFIRLHRAALESDHVSSQIHHWIDLIFGSLQRGSSAVSTYNRYRPHCYYPLAFENAKPQFRSLIVNTIREFGQVPVQLFTKPHPTRHQSRDMSSSFDQVSLFSLKYLQQISEAISDSILFVRKVGSKVVTISRSFAYLEHQLSHNFVRTEWSGLGSMLDFHIIDEDLLTNSIYSLSQNGKHLITVCHWDSTFKLFDTKSLKLLQSVCRHKDIIMCCNLVESSTANYLITGSRDTTVIVWNYYPSSPRHFDNTPLHILHGHDDAVTCITSDVDLDVVLTGSKDGTIIVFCLSKGRYMRTIEYPLMKPVHLLSYVQVGYFLTHSRVDNSLYLFSINGFLIKKAIVKSPISQVLVFSNSVSQSRSFLSLPNTCRSSYLDYIEGYFFVGFSDGALEIWSLFSFECIRSLARFNSGITSLCLSDDCTSVIVGLDDGKIAIFSV